MYIKYFDRNAILLENKGFSFLNKKMAEVVYIASAIPFKTIPIA